MGFTLCEHVQGVCCRTGMDNPDIQSGLAVVSLVQRCIIAGKLGLRLPLWCEDDFAGVLIFLCIDTCTRE
ncbi:hypothetical protein SDC9_129814 [bioreactor metagenome]|uniref:Uncharacterized protein n=1 Tax=bioreactor metagenome TaxID=1076179 RepID=A0A645D1Z4_9ZZZZ